MKRKLFRSTFLAAILVFIACFTLTMGTLYVYFSRQHMNELESKAELLANAINMYGDSFLDMADLGDNTRITVIDPDGTVLFDSVSDPNVMENHFDRKEVQEALTNGAGRSTRYSITLSERTNNYALLLSGGHILRLSDTQYTPLTLMGNIFPLIIAVLAIAVFLSFAFSIQVSKSITSPINSIDLTSPREEDIYPELRPLIGRINAQNRQIDRQMEELKLEHERQDRLRREFTANVSHELKTPLTSISGYAEIIRNGMVEPEDISVFAGRIYSESRRLISLVEDIIRLSRLEDTEISLPRADIDLYEAADSILEHLYTVAGKQNITMKLEGEHCIINGSPQIIDEMIYNLCDNAIKYNNPGGSVTVSIAHGEKGTSLTVADTGIGIPEEDLERVFERFYRMDKSHSKAVGGTGLGLSIVKHGAACHNAEIICKSTVGVGTSITIVFPAAIT